MRKFWTRIWRMCRRKYYCLEYSP